MIRFRLPFLLFATFLCTSCSLLEQIAAPPVPPTPLPADEPLILEASEAAEIINPISAIQPSLDPDILALVNAVSEQNLLVYVQTLQDFRTRNSFSDTQSDTEGIGAARRWIKTEFERVSNGRMTVEFEDFTLNYAGLTANQRNIVATLPGISGYNDAIVITAHYDSRVGEATDGTSYSPSADDNASGVAMLLELARLLSSRQWNQTIIFAALAAEEQQTAGSRSFVNTSFVDGRAVAFSINNDGIGGRQGIPQSVRLYAPEMELSQHGQLARYVDYINQLYQPDFPIELLNAEDREGRYGDQREFQRVGIPAVRLIESVEDQSLLNTSTDTWEKLDYTYLANVLRVNLVVAANWLGSPPPPEPPLITEAGSEDSIVLTWNVNPQAAAYAISVREVDSLRTPVLRTVSSREAGNVILTDLDPQQAYGISIAPLTFSGRLGGFSDEVLKTP